MAYRLILLLFLASGALGLGYQVLWSKYLLDAIGVNAYCYAIVLAAFMTGLALGSTIFGRLADRVRAPLLIFAGLEAGVGLYAFAFPALVAEVAARAGGLGAKAVAVGLLLLPPTILMGGTYPAVLRHATDRHGVVGRRAAQLYAANAAGAVVGALLIAFAVMPLLGLRSSVRLLGVTNLVVALLALRLATRREAVGAAPAEPLSLQTPEAPGGEASRVRRSLALVAVAGFTSFAYETAWTRYFSVVLGSSTYSFAIILAAFITGIALGSAWLARKEEALADPVRFFGWTQLLLGLLVLLPLPLYPYVPWLLLQYSDLFSSTKQAFVIHEIGKIVLCYAVLLPPTVFVGMSLPLVLRGVSGGLERLGRDAGRVYAWNTWGNVLGALAAGLLLLPALGMEGLLRLTALVSGFVGFAAVWMHLPRENGARRRAILASAGLVALVAGAHLSTGRWQPEWFTMTPFRRMPRWSWANARAFLANRVAVMFEDDPAANVIVYRDMNRGQTLALLVDGKTDATSDSDMPTQLLVGHVPLMLAPEPQDVLVIGLGSGVTAGATLRHPIRRLDVVELVSAIPRAARFFATWNGEPLSDPRTRLVVDDARSYLAHTPHQYDVVISEPSNPWMAGVGSLYSKEFYGQAIRALRPKGVYLQWLQSYEMGDDTFAAAVRTFHSVFPFIYAFQGNANDVLLLGSLQPLRPDWGRLIERFERPRVKEQMLSVQIEDLSGFLALQTLSPATVERLASLTTLENTDDNHLLEYRCPRDLFARVAAGIPARFDERPRAAPSLFWTEFVRQHRGRVSLLATLHALSGGRTRVEGLASAHAVAAYHLDELAPWRRETISLFPDSFRAEPPFSRAALAERISRLLATGEPVLAAGLVARYSAALLMESVLSEAAAGFWMQQTEQWFRVASAAQRGEMRSFRIDLLMAVGESESAGHELLAWTRDRFPPTADWAISRACQTVDADLCSSVRARYGPSPLPPDPLRSADPPAATR